MTTIDKQNSGQFLLNPVFILCLLLLFLNDHVFKYEYGNWLTGKLSDFAGMIVLPAVLAFIWPKTKAIKWHVLATGLFFLFWKSPFSQGIIDAINGLSVIQISRVIDYSDLSALFVLPLSYWFLTRLPQWRMMQIRGVSFRPIYLFIPAVMVLLATSVSRRFLYSPPAGNLPVYGVFVKMKMSKEDVIQQLQAQQIDVYEDSIRFKEAIKGQELSASDSVYWADRNYYRVDELILKKDTIHDLQFMFTHGFNGESSIAIESMNIDEHLFEEKKVRKLQRYFSRQVKKRIHRALSQ